MKLSFCILMLMHKKICFPSLVLHLCELNACSESTFAIYCPIDFHWHCHTQNFLEFDSDILFLTGFPLQHIIRTGKSYWKQILSYCLRSKCTEKKGSFRSCWRSTAFGQLRALCLSPSSLVFNRDHVATLVVDVHVTVNTALVRIQWHQWTFSLHELRTTNDACSDFKVFVWFERESKPACAFSTHCSTLPLHRNVYAIPKFTQLRCNAGG